MYAIQYIYSNLHATELSRQRLLNLIDVDLMVERAELSDLHKIVLGIRHIDIQEFLELRSCPVNIYDGSDLSPLNYAAARGDVHSTRALLDAGADPDFPQNIIGAKPLHSACRYGNLEVLRLLIQAGNQQIYPEFGFEEHY